MRLCPHCRGTGRVLPPEPSGREYDARDEAAAEMIARRMPKADALRAIAARFAVSDPCARYIYQRGQRLRAEASHG